MKIQKWSSTHRDIYAYHKQAGKWVKVGCNSEGCTAPGEFPRGTEFTYNANQSQAAMADADLRLEEWNMALLSE